MKFKDTLFSKYEKLFVNEVILNRKRVDGRSHDDYRKLDIQFGKEWGVCIVSLGETKVMAQVTCEVQQPKTIRPNEGLLFLNVEISQMAVPNIEQNVLSELHVHLSRLLEKCIKESHCVDLEALCIVAEEKVWNIRVDLTVLNYEGNMVGCCSVAAISALSHFRRPDVTIDGEKVFIHTSAEKDPIPLSMHHYPVAISYAIYDNGNCILADPTDLEERNSQAELVLGMNAYRELCGIHLSGTVLQELNVLLQCAQKAANTASELVQQIKTAIENDEQQRKEKSISCLVESIDVNRKLQLSQSRSFVLNMSSDEIIKEANKITASTAPANDVSVSDDEVIEIRSSGFKSSETFHKKRSKKRKNVEVSSWSNDENSDDETVKSVKEGKSKTDLSVKDKTKEKEVILSSEEDDIALVGEITTEDRIIERIELSGDSEEEDIVTMMPADIENITGEPSGGHVKYEND
ncbi:exosome complex component Rrp45 [Lycorma delicatula]|uniref:exosome complex component Rrp45 n=1 Tax=Lycorma delicatula TaxID=130591 RepID=UPI003F50F4EC